MTVTYVDTKDMVADIFTKALGRELFIKHRGSLVRPVMTTKKAGSTATSPNA